MTSTTLRLALSIALLTATPLAQAGGPSYEFSQALGYSGQAIGHSATAAVRLSSGVVALPFKAVGALGQGIGRAGDDLWNTASWDRPLPLTDEHLTVGPSPDQAINQP